MKNIILSTIAAAVLSTSAFAAEVNEWVNPKGNTVLAITFDNGDVLKYRPISDTYRFQPTDGGYILADDVVYFDDFLADSEEELDDVIDQLDDLGDYDNVVVSISEVM